MNIVKYCLPLLALEKFKFISFAIGSMLVSVMTIFIAYYTGGFIDSLVYVQSDNILVRTIIILVVLNVANLILKFVNGVNYARLIFDLTYQLSCKVIGGAMEMRSRTLTIFFKNP